VINPYKRKEKKKIGRPISNKLNIKG